MKKVIGIYTTNIKDQYDHTAGHLDRLNIPHDFKCIDDELKELKPDEGFGSPYWVQATVKKTEYGLNELNSIADGEILFYSDVDVQPLQHYSKLEKYLDFQDLVFMDEYHKKKPGYRINSGFYAVRKTQKTLDFFNDWHDLCLNPTPFILSDTKEPFSDQNILNKMLRGKELWRKYDGRFSVFPHEVVSGDCDSINSDTVAYHAIRISGSEEKIKKMENAYNLYSE